MEDNQQHAQSESETEFMVPNLSLCDPLLEHFEQSCVWLDVSQVPSILAAVDCRTVGVKIVIWGTLVSFMVLKLMRSHFYKIKSFIGWNGMLNSTTLLKLNIITWYA